MTGTFPTAAKAADILERVRKTRPRVHCLMNTVVQKFTADGITVIGGIPSMTTFLEEIESFVTKADALTVNLGTLDAERRKVIRLAIEIANASGKPWIVDPVHCDYSPSRLEFARELIALSPTIVRGNRAEMSLIGNVPDAVRIETGPVDHLRDTTRGVRIVNGHPWMAKVTGTGCLSGGIIAAFMAVGEGCADGCGRSPCCHRRFRRIGWQNRPEAPAPSNRHFWMRFPKSRGKTSSITRG